MKRTIVYFSTKEHIVSSIKLLLLILSLFAGWYAFRNSFIGDYFKNYVWIKHQIEKKSLLGPVIFILLGGLTTTFGFPRLALCTLAGFVFGFSKGILFGLTGTIWGCIITYYYAKFMGRAFIEKRLPDKLKKYEPLLHQNSFLITLMIRLFPVGNNTLTNLLGGVSSVKALPYFLASAIGYLPQTIIFSLIGSGVSEGGFLRPVLSIVLFIISVLLMALIARKIIKTSDAVSVKTSITSEE